MNQVELSAHVYKSSLLYTGKESLKTTKGLKLLGLYAFIVIRERIICDLF
jgi:hypothetical protein